MAPNTDIINEWIKINRKFSPIPALEELGIIIKKTERGYVNSELLGIIILATAANTTLETASEAIRGILGEAPSADTVLRHIEKHDENKLERMINKALEKIFKTSWIPKVKALVAIDITDIPYYGNIDAAEVKHTKPGKGTHYAFRFIVASIVSERGKFILHIHLIRKGEDLKEALEKVLKAVRKLVKIAWLILDKGFFQVRVIRMLKRMGISFVIAVPRRERLDELASHGSFIARYTVTSKKYGREPVYVVGFVDEKGAVYYATNKLIRRKRCGDMHRRYKKRWRIEVSFAVVKGALAKTTSRAASVRIFLFGISCILYNLWILTNFSWTSREAKMRIKAPETRKRYTHWILIVLIVIIATYLSQYKQLLLNDDFK